MKNILTWLLALLALGADAAPSSPALALYYGENPPWEALQAFDTVVVDPDHVPNPAAIGLAHTTLAAYVSVGEVHPTRAYANSIPKNWLRGENKDWGSRLIDQSQAAWPAFFTDHIIQPLWAAGYRSFFFDTLDSYQLFAKTPQERALQEAGLVAIIQTVKQRYPEAKLIFNRGFEVLERTHKLVDMVAAESLFQGYNATTGKYNEVPEGDRQWLLGQLTRVRDTYHLPVLAIDYVPPAERALARTTAQRITNLGFTPWVATPDLTTLGVGSIEVMPRKVLVVHSPLRAEFELNTLDPPRLLAMPLNYLGYAPEYVDTLHLPTQGLPGRYAGAVIWLTEQTSPAEAQKLSAWLLTQTADKLPLAFISLQGEMLDGAVGNALGLQLRIATSTLSPKIVQQDSMVGFERAPNVTADSFFGLTLTKGRPLLTVERDGVTQHAAGIAPWGGYVVDPYGVANLPGGAGSRWVVNPFSFLRDALQLPDMPVADVSTESGRRMLMVHMDGDGFVSRSELPGNPLAGEVVRDRVVNKYPIPMTISVIEAELSPQGLYPGLSALAEKVAQEIFRAPHVAIASHSYSHPFYWHKIGNGDGADGYNLRIPGYRFDLHREIEGSVEYIQRRLAPAGKKVDMFFWTGDCVPGSDALALAGKAGLLNMNGGDTVATQSSPTLTEVEGLGLQRAGGFQVYAPNQNENVYTNNWRGPFYGFERVIETFEFTDKPRRLKPVNIYFHTYLTTKRAGMQSLDKVFSYALAQENTPVYVSEYARKVLDFQRLAIARTATGWRVRGAVDLRTLRFPTSLGLPDMDASSGVAGYRKGPEENYLHLASDTADLVFAATAARAPKPLLVSANARVQAFEQTAGTRRWRLQGHVPLQFTLSQVGNCRIRAAGRDLTPVRRDGDLSYYELSAHAAGPLEAICRH
jgi:polysaccharide biosynthesis protein PelA